MALQFSGLVFAFTSGVISIFSPCSYALLPGYISYYLGSRFGIVKAITGGIACTLGLLTVFTAIGALIASLLKNKSTKEIKGEVIDIKKNINSKIKEVKKIAKKNKK